MTAVEITNIVAIVTSPVIAVVVTLFYQSTAARKQQRFNIFLTLLSTRHFVITDEQARAFNSIDVIFHDSVEVRDRWKEYFEILTQKSRIGEWPKKKLSLLKAMADEVGYRGKIDHMDLDRIYFPDAVMKTQENQSKLLEKAIAAIDAGNFAISVNLKSESGKPT